MPLMDLPAHIARQRVKEAEAAALAHLAEHTAVEWATELAAVRAELAAVKAQARFGGFGDAAHDAAPSGSLTLAPAPAEHQDAATIQRRKT
jgi:hypothetical protein